MGIRVGVDIVYVDDIIKLVESEKGRKKFFTDREIAYCMNSHNVYEKFAGRFAAKEALLKTIGLGILDGVSLKHIEIINTDTGMPELKLSDTAMEAISGKYDIENFSITISHSRGIAVAVAVLLT